MYSRCGEEQTRHGDLLLARECKLDDVKRRKAWSKMAMGINKLIRTLASSCMA